MKRSRKSDVPGKRVGAAFRARFSKGVLEPLENLKLEEWQEVAIVILPSPPADRDWLRRTAGGWVGLVDGEELKRNIYEHRLLNTRLEPRL